MEAPGKSRPSLEPIWTDYNNLGGYPKTAFRVARSPAFSASPMSPKTAPSPMYPATPAYDDPMKRHEKAMVESLGQRSREPSLSERPAAVLLSPISESSSLVARMSNIAVASPPLRGSSRGQLPSPPAREQPLALARRQSLAAETRSMLLERVSQSQASSLGSVVDRRQSAPATPAHRPQRRNSQQLQMQLRAWGHVYYGNEASANIFVAAASLRRHSTASASGEDDEAARSPSRITIRARVRPRALERKPFVIQRSFDLAELRATVPDTSPVSGPMSPRRPSVDVSPRTALPGGRRRSSSARSGRGSPPAAHDLRSGGKPDTSRSLHRGANAVPLHFGYVRTYLPVLAALMLSGHVREGDIIDLPLPHPEAWPQTVAYVYTGQGVLTDAIKQNILHLGGRL